MNLYALNFCRNECIYCEKTFSDRTVLMDHMRKRNHREVNPKNNYYDKFYIINYLVGQISLKNYLKLLTFRWFKKIYVFYLIKMGLYRILLYTQIYNKIQKFKRCFIFLFTTVVSVFSIKFKNFYLFFFNTFVNVFIRNFFFKL